MPTKFIGTTFPPSSQWHQDEIDLIETILKQINRAWPDDQNLFINTTWFGPQFTNNTYQTFLEITEKNKFDNLFLLAAADPVFVNPEQIESMVARSGVKKVFKCGHFDGEHQFNFHSQVIPKYFKNYSIDELKMGFPDHIYLCYNRKPREHRVDLIKKLVEQNLTDHGIISLGRNDEIYSNNSLNDLCFLLDETPEDYAKEGNWNLSMKIGIPHDIHSLGNMDFWRGHFLTIVSETEFFPWDNLFVSEKTWKPIIGLRPFLINGQTQVYRWLRQHGFRTFERYWPDIEIEDLPEYEVHDSIVSVVRWLSILSRSEIQKIYQEMLLDLLHNRERFFEFAKEQSYKIQTLFDGTQ